MSKKSDTFANDNKEPTALAIDSGKSWPILEGEDAERFIRIMHENERKAAEMAKIPPTKEELQKRLDYSKFIYRFKEDELKELEKEIKELEKRINEYN